MDIVSIGEALIDFTPSGAMDCYQMHFGGAPANLSVVASRMGVHTSFIGMVGYDRFGRFIRKTFEEEGVDLRGLSVTQSASTTLAFVHLASNGERSFEFVRKPGADMLITASLVSEELIRSAKILHFGSASLASVLSRDAVLTAVKIAHSANIMVSFDPNYRELQWNSPEEAIKEIHDAMQYCDLLKVSQEEAYLLTGFEEPLKSSEQLLAYGTQLVVVTCGQEGAFYRTKDCFGQVEGFRVKAVDTTGAGDAFWGAFLAQFVGLKEQNQSRFSNVVQLRECLLFANAVGAMTVLQNGAISARLTADKVKNWMVNN